VRQACTNDRSRILDTNYAQEATTLARAQIVQQASTSVLVQRNEVPQAVLSLLQ
jgi:flagellin